MTCGFDHTLETLRPWLCCGALFVLIGCSGSDDGEGDAQGAGGARGMAGGGGMAGAAAMPPPADEAGPFTIGITSLMIDDGEGTGRTLPIDVWYPAEHPDGSETFQYTLEILGLNPMLPSPGGAVEDAPGTDDGGPYPVIVFSHGNSGIRFQSLYLTEHLASHGFVVAAPDHVGNTFLSSLGSEPEIDRTEIARLRPGDVSRALDAVAQASADSASPLFGLADESRAGVAGHSFGGFTAFRSAGATVDVAAAQAECAADPSGFFCANPDTIAKFPTSARDDRFLAAVPQAPGGATFLAGGFGAIPIPVMVQAGSADVTTPVEVESIPAYDELTGRAHLLVIDRAGHFTYSDMCTLVELVPGAAMLFANVFGDGCGDANIEPSEAHRLINGYTTAFFYDTVAGTSGYEDWFDADAPLPAGVSDLRMK